MMSDGLFRDMLLWRGFNDISWKMKLVFMLLYPVMVVVMIGLFVSYLAKFGIKIARILLVGIRKTNR